MTVFRNFCFTCNNYTKKDIEDHLALKHSYIIIGKETGQEGTPHLQGYVELKKQMRFKAIKKLLPKTHFEKRKGTAQQAADYCKKDDDYVEHGTISNPGKRNDLEKVYEMTVAGHTNVEISQSAPGTYMRFYKAIDRVRLDYARLDNKFEPVQVTVVYGESGAGKTKYCYEQDPELYRLMPSESTVWFDGYHGQTSILIDDFYGWLKYGYLLQLLDGYKFQLPVKGGFTWKQWKTVYITSNVHPANWYTKGFTSALERRIGNIIYLKN